MKGKKYERGIGIWGFAWRSKRTVGIPMVFFASQPGIVTGRFLEKGGVSTWFNVAGNPGA